MMKKYLKLAVASVMMCLVLCPALILFRDVILTAIAPGMLLVGKFLFKEGIAI